MQIRKFRIVNFKSYGDSSPIEFSPGLNVVVGQNNAGKSALLESLTLNPAWNPHRSPETMPFEGAPPLQHAILNVSFSVSRDEVQEMLASMPDTAFYLPYPEHQSEFARSISFIDDSMDSFRRLADWFLSQDRHMFEMTYEWSPRGSSWSPTAVPSYGHYAAPHGTSGWTGRRARYTFTPTKGLAPLGYEQSTQEIGNQLLGQFLSRIYVFRAERPDVGECAIGNHPTLASNASNLASVLNILQSNRIRFERFNKTLRSIFPHVPWVSVRPTTHNHQLLEILVWPFESHPAREDLSIPLKHSGTGLGQVLSILYVILTATRPTVIVIDEPQSFLHPGAARKLIEVLMEHPQHQYIITTHSPSIVSVGAQRTVILARVESGATVLHQLKTEDAKAQEMLLAELGARLSDVFGSDHILWVEGQTEELCYRRIFRELVGKSLMGTQLLGVRNTGDLQGVAAERTIEIYGKLVSGTSLVPPALGFLFDSECLSSEKKRELSKKSNGLLSLIPRRMYENYLLHPASIAAVANAIEGFRSTEVRAEEVSALLTQAFGDRKYYCERLIPATLPEQRSVIHAKIVLRDIFSELSETRVRYDEVRHGLALTEWLIANAPDELTEIRDLLVKLLIREQSPG